MIRNPNPLSIRSLLKKVIVGTLLAKSGQLAQAATKDSCAQDSTQISAAIALPLTQQGPKVSTLQGNLVSKKDSSAADVETLDTGVTRVKQAYTTLNQVNVTILDLSKATGEEIIAKNDDLQESSEDLIADGFNALISDGAAEAHNLESELASIDSEFEDIRSTPGSTDVSDEYALFLEVKANILAVLGDIDTASKLAKTHAPDHADQAFQLLEHAIEKSFNSTSPFVKAMLGAAQTNSDENGAAPLTSTEANVFPDTMIKELISASMGDTFTDAADRSSNLVSKKVDDLCEKKTTLDVDTAVLSQERNEKKEDLDTQKEDRLNAFGQFSQEGAIFLGEQLIAAFLLYLPYTALLSKLKNSLSTVNEKSKEALMTGLRKGYFDVNILIDKLNENLSREEHIPHVSDEDKDQWKENSDSFNTWTNIEHGEKNIKALISDFWESPNFDPRIAPSGLVVTEGVHNPGNTMTAYHFGVRKMYKTEFTPEKTVVENMTDTASRMWEGTMDYSERARQTIGETCNAAATRIAELGRFRPTMPDISNVFTRGAGTPPSGEGDVEIELGAGTSVPVSNAAFSASNPISRQVPL